MTTRIMNGRIHRALSGLLPLIMALSLVTGLGVDSSGSAYTESIHFIAAADASSVTGRGPEEVACLLCSGVILGAGAASVFGLITVAGIFPEPVIACAAACVIAFT